MKLRVLITLLFWAGTALAADADLRQEAAARFDRGVKLFEAQDYSAALAEFEAAYRLVPRYQVLFDIGVAQKRLFRYSDAVRALTRYLAEGGEHVPPDRREQVERELREIRTLSAEVTVRVDGLPALVEVDGRAQGETPLSAPLLIGPGHHLLRATREGDEPAQKSIDVISGEKLEVVLTPPPKVRAPTTAEVTLATHPAGAELALDGRKLGRAPWSGTVDPGGHQIDALLPGYKKARQELMVTAGQARSLTVELEVLPPPAKWYKRWYTWVVPLVLVGGAVTAGVLGYNATHQAQLRTVEW